MGFICFIFGGFRLLEFEWGSSWGGVGRGSWFFIIWRYRECGGCFLVYG